MTDANDVGIIGRVSIRMSVAVLVAIAVIALLLAFVLLPTERDIIVFSAALVGGAATVYSAFYAASTLRIRVKHYRQSKAFEMIGGLNEHQSAKLRVFIEKNIDNRSVTANELYRKIVDDSDCLAIVSAVLGVYEDMGIAVQEDFVDEVVLHRAAAFLIPWTFSRLRPYIEEERIQSNDKGLYIEMERLAISWMNGKYLSTGKPIPSGSK